MQLPFASFAGGEDFFCGALSTGPMHCWGAHDDLVKGAFTQVVSTRKVACGLRTDGTVSCIPEADSKPFSFGDDPEWKTRRLGGGSYHVCAMKKDGAKQATAVRCFGPSDPCAAPAAPESLRAKFIAVGDCHACAADESGKLECWGKTDGMQLPAPGTLAVDDLAAADGFVCALLAGGALRCFGTAPALATDVHYKAISAAGRTLCGKGETGGVTCAGDVVASWSEPVTRFAIGRRSICAQLGARDIRCVGAKESGQLDPPPDPLGAPPAEASPDADRRAALFTEFLRGFPVAGLPLSFDKSATIEAGDRIAPRFRDFAPPPEGVPEADPPRYVARIPTPDAYVAVVLYQDASHQLELRTYSKTGAPITTRRIASFTSEDKPREEHEDGTAIERRSNHTLESIIGADLRIESTETTGTEAVHYVRPLKSGTQPVSHKECGIEHTVWTDSLDDRGKIHRVTAKVEPVYHATDQTGCGERWPFGSS